MSIRSWGTAGLRVIRLRIRAILPPRFRFLRGSGGLIDGIDTGPLVPTCAGAAGEQRHRQHGAGNEQNFPRETLSARNPVLFESILMPHNLA
ncbi:hypothetical protein GCM10023238_05910 [Streptomyces heliomycini]